MEWTGKILSVGCDYLTGQYNITLSINESSVLNDINCIMDCEKLSLSAKKYRKKRSLDSNAYAWALITRIAEAVNSSKDEVYEEMLQKYGYLYQDEEGYIVGTYKTDTDMSKVPGHWKFYKSNGKFNSYLMIKGSSEYDSAEMAKFIDRIVEEAKELGIETLTPAELERMKTEWRNG